MVSSIDCHAKILGSNILDNNIRVLHFKQVHKLLTYLFKLIEILNFSNEVVFYFIFTPVKKNIYIFTVLMA